MYKYDLKDFTHSETAIKNNIDNNIKNFKIAQKLIHLDYFARKLWQLFSFVITSGYRADKLNKLLGGISNSQHRKGEAMDIVPSTISVEEAYNKIIKSGFFYDQLIWEKRDKKEWLHISYKMPLYLNRGQCFKNFK